MLGGDLAAIVAGDSAALLLAWLAGSVVQRYAGSSPWRVAVQRSLGLSLIALAAFLMMRQALPDLFVLPLVFLVAAAVDVLTALRTVKPAERYVISILISLAIVGSLVIVDTVMRAGGHHLSALI